jgi:DNA helicase HerA-like ATPase
MSADGRTVHFSASLESGLQVGGTAIVSADDASPSLVVQIRDARFAERDGPQFDIATPVDSIEVNTTTFKPVLRSIVGTGVVLGTLTSDGFTTHDHSQPFGERFVRPASPDEIETIVVGLDGNAPSIEIGTYLQAPHVAARLRSKGFARHTFMCGQSGSGKTYTTGALFERLLAGTTLPIVVLDPNSDHVHLDELSNPDDASEGAQRFREAATGVRVARARGLPASYTLCADFSDLPIEWQALLLRLHPVNDADEFHALARTTKSLEAPYSARDVMEAARAAAETDPPAMHILRRITNLGIAEWDVWRRDGERSITTMNLRSERCVVFDLGSLTRSDERATVALALLGSRWGGRAVREPVLIAIDEAHNILPSATDDPLLQAITELGIVIAGEGRKFGLHLFVATQRPSKVHPNVVSQCDNLVLMRMNGTGDIDDLVTMFSHVPEPMIRQASTFGLGQALFAGPIAPVPMLAQVGSRLSAEGGGDLPTSWAL